VSDVTVRCDGTGEDFEVDIQLGYDVLRQSENLVHRIIGRADPDVTLKPTPLRTGTFVALLMSQGQAEALAFALARSSTFTWTSEGWIGFAFVVSGQVRTKQEPDSSSAWSVTFDWTEVVS
jgi:hypothetical protein